MYNILLLLWWRCTRFTLYNNNNNNNIDIYDTVEYHVVMSVCTSRLILFCLSLVHIHTRTRGPQQHVLFFFFMYYNNIYIVVVCVGGKRRVPGFFSPIIHRRVSPIASPSIFICDRPKGKNLDMYITYTKKKNMTWTDGNLRYFNVVFEIRLCETIIIII